MKDPDIANISLRIVPRRRTVGRRERRLVHEFGGGDVAAQRARIVDQALRLIRPPKAVRIAAAWADGKGGDDLCIDRARKVDDAAPLRAA
ncbi:hypothetical protein [Bradyrhizobium diazoefficiens]